MASQKCALKKQPQHCLKNQPIIYWYNVTHAEINSNIQKTHRKLSCMALNFFQQPHFHLLDCWPAIRPRCMGPVLSITKALSIHNTDLLFEEDLSTVPLYFLSSFEVQSSSRMVRKPHACEFPLFIIRHACVMCVLNYAGCEKSESLKVLFNTQYTAAFYIINEHLYNQ